MEISSLQYRGPCSCGREHKMETIFSLVKSGCLKKLDEYLKKYGLDGYRVAVYDENAYKATSDRHPRAELEIVLDPEDLHANEHGVEMLMKRLPSKASLLIAIGSGTVHDLVRYCAYEKKLDFVSCPTAASVDGFCSSVAAMTWNGCKKTLTAVAPKIVLADLDIIRHAPLRLARSGFGDMVGKYVALTDWRIANIVKREFYCERIAEMTLQATQAVIRSAEGILSGEESAYEKLMYGLLLSGLAMQMMGNSRPASGAEHHISHLIEMEPVGLGIRSAALHGEKVGVGTLLVLKEYEKAAKREKIRFCNYSTYSQQEIFSVFGTVLSEEIRKENREDAAFGITGEALAAVWDEVKRELKSLPSASLLSAQYKALGIKSTLEEIGVPEAMERKIITSSPMVRNRLTFMRLCKCLD